MFACCSNTIHPLYTGCNTTGSNLCEKLASYMPETILKVYDWFDCKVKVYTDAVEGSLCHARVVGILDADDNINKTAWKRVVKYNNDNRLAFCTTHEYERHLRMVDTCETTSCLADFCMRKDNNGSNDSGSTSNPAVEPIQ